jgi:hypothetical protein
MYLLYKLNKTYRIIYEEKKKLCQKIFTFKFKINILI